MGDAERIEEALEWLAEFMDTLKAGDDSLPIRIGDNHTLIITGMIL